MFISAHRYSIERLPEATIGGGALCFRVKDDRKLPQIDAMTVNGRSKIYVAQDVECHGPSTFQSNAYLWTNHEFSQNKLTLSSFSDVGVQLHERNKDTESQHLVACMQRF